jgi:antitoxin (DNA-binding transcriptional repressor) of toxin-antitoxin stability system
MTLVSLEQAQANLPDLIHGLGPGDELMVMENDKPIAKIVAPPAKSECRKPGTMAGTVLHMAPDFDSPLDEFQDLSS